MLPLLTPRQRRLPDGGTNTQTAPLLPTDGETGHLQPNRVTNMNSFTSSVTGATAMLVATTSGCGALVRPEDGGSIDVITEPRDATSNDQTNSDEGNVVDATPPRFRNESILVFERQNSLRDQLQARLLRDEPIGAETDSTSGSCRTYDSNALPETHAGALTVRRLSSTNTLQPNTSVPRSLYFATFEPGSPVGARIEVAAEGSATFPAFSLSEVIPQPLEVTDPSRPSTIPWDSTQAITIRWSLDSSTDLARLGIQGARAGGGPFLSTFCTVPISDGQFTFTPSMLSRFDSLPMFRVISLSRARIARGTFGNAPVSLIVTSERLFGWISFR